MLLQRGLLVSYVPLAHAAAPRHFFAPRSKHCFKKLAYGAPEVASQRTVQGHAAPLTTQPHQPHSPTGRGARSEQREHDRCPSSKRQSRPASRSGPTS